MLILLSALLSALGSMFRSRAALELEHMALRHQIGVLKRLRENGRVSFDWKDYADPVLSQTGQGCAEAC